MYDGIPLNCDFSSKDTPSTGATGFSQTLGADTRQELVMANPGRDCIFEVATVYAHGLTYSVAAIEMLSFKRMFFSIHTYIHTYKQFRGKQNNGLSGVPASMTTITSP